MMEKDTREAPTTPTAKNKPNPCGSDSSYSTKIYKLCPAAREDPAGCPYGGASRWNCTDCQDLPIWYFDSSQPTKVLEEE